MKPYLRSIFVTGKLTLCKFFLKQNIHIEGASLLGYNTRIEIAKSGKLNIGRHVISDGRFTVIVSDRAEISIGDNVYFNENCMLSAKDNIKIGAYCQFGPGVNILTKITYLVRKTVYLLSIQRHR